MLLDYYISANITSFTLIHILAGVKTSSAETGI